MNILPVAICGCFGIKALQDTMDALGQTGGVLMVAFFLVIVLFPVYRFLRLMFAVRFNRPPQAVKKARDAYDPVVYTRQQVSARSEQQRVGGPRYAAKDDARPAEQVAPPSGSNEPSMDEWLDRAHAKKTRRQDKIAADEQARNVVRARNGRR